MQLLSFSSISDRINNHILKTFRDANMREERRECMKFKAGEKKPAGLSSGFTSQKHHESITTKTDVTQDVSCSDT